MNRIFSLAALSAEISLGDIVVETGFAPGAECSVKAVVTGEGDMTQETVLTPVIARRVAGGLSVIASLESQSISLDKGETAVVEFSGTLPDDLSGSDFRFAIFDESNTPVNGRSLTVAYGRGHSNTHRCRRRQKNCNTLNSKP